MKPIQKDPEICAPETPALRALDPKLRYLIIGVSLALFNFGFYSILANLIIKNNDLLWLATLISTAATTILAYLLHSKITWRERNPGKSGIYKFFLWNALLAFAIGPLFTQLFSLIKPLYTFAYSFCEMLHLPFSYNFVESTGVFVLVSILTTILNYFFYDRLVFGKNRN